jgi:hypothetical protein
MNLSKMLLATGLTAVLAGVATPAFAQHHGGGGGQSRGASGGHGGGGAVSRGPSVNHGGAVSRGPSQSAAPRSAPGPRGVAPGRATSPYYSVRGGGVVRGGNAVVRPYNSARGGGYLYGGGRYSVVAPVRFYRPYYTFRPRLSLGFGLWMGYPFAYSYPYYDPFYYPYGYVSPYAYGYPAYGYPATAYPAYPPASAYPPPAGYPPQANYPPSDPQGSIAAQPGQANTGGLSFEITPSDAQLFIDGAMVGTVGQFTPTSQPLGLAAGRHHVEVKAPGYRTMSFDVDIIAGQVIPYQGTLER